MGVKIKGLEQAKKNMDRWVDDVVGIKSVRAVQSALMIFGLEVAEITPVETSTLVNSLYRDVTPGQRSITGRVGMSANYAAYVNRAPGTLKGKPRPSGKGVYWGPNGVVNFFDVGIQRGKEDAERAIKTELAR